LKEVDSMNSKNFSSAGSSSSRLVYSTEQGGRLCPECERPKDKCVCKKGKVKDRPVQQKVPNDSIVRVSRQTSGRKGKGVTIITGVPLSGAELETLARQLKQKCGAGGTLRDGVIEIQGEHRDLLVQELQARGWTVKKAGG